MITQEQAKTINKILRTFEIQEEANMAILCLTPSGVKIYINPDGSINNTNVQ